MAVALGLVTSTDLLSSLTEQWHHNSSHIHSIRHDCHNYDNYYVALGLVTSTDLLSSLTEQQSLLSRQ